MLDRLYRLLPSRINIQYTNNYGAEISLFNDGYLTIPCSTKNSTLHICEVLNTLFARDDIRYKPSESQLQTITLHCGISYLGKKIRSKLYGNDNWNKYMNVYVPCSIIPNTYYFEEMAKFSFKYKKYNPQVTQKGPFFKSDSLVFLIPCHYNISYICLLLNQVFKNDQIKFISSDDDIIIHYLDTTIDSFICSDEYYHDSCYCGIKVYVPLEFAALFYGV